MTRRGGTALLAVLSIIGLVMLLAFCTASFTTLTLRVATHDASATTALHAAEQVLAEAVADLCNDPTFGSHQETLQHQYADASQAKLSFKTSP